MSDYIETSIVNHFFRNSSVASPSGHVLKLFTTDYEDDGTMTEVTGGSYTPQSITFGAPTDGVSSNSGILTFSGMPACTVISGAVFVGANMLGGNNFSEPRVVGAGQTFIVPVGEVIIRVR